MTAVNKGLAYFDASYSLKQFAVSEDQSNLSTYSSYFKHVQFSTPVFIGIKPKRSFQLVLVTIPNEGIYLYEASEQQPLRSWVLPENLKVEGPAVIKINSPLNVNKGKNNKLNALKGGNKGSDSGIETDISSLIDTQVFQLLDNGFTMYCKVREHDGIKKVAVWNSKDKRSIVKFNFEIQAIHIVNSIGDAGQNNGGELLVLFNNGQAQFYDEKVKAMADPITIFDQQIKYSYGFTIENSAFDKSSTPNFSTHGFAVLILSKSDKGHKFHLIQVQNRSTKSDAKNNSIIKVTPVEFPEQNLETLNFDFELDYHPRSNTLALIDSTYSLHTFKIIGNTDSNAFKLHLKEQSTYKINKTICPDNIPHMALLSQDYLAVTTTNFDSETDQLETTMFLLDSKLGAVVSKTKISSFEAQPYTKDSPYFHRVTAFAELNLLLTGTSFKTKGEKSKRVSDLTLTPFQRPAVSNLLATFNKAELTNYFLENSNDTDSKSLNKVVSDLDDYFKKDKEPESDLLDLVLNHINDIGAEVKGSEVKIPVDTIKKMIAFIHNTCKYTYVGKAFEVESNPLDEFAINWYTAKTDLSSLKDELTIVKKASLLPNLYLEKILHYMTSNDPESTENQIRYDPEVVCLLLTTNQLTSALVQKSGFKNGLLSMLLQYQDWYNIPLALQQVKDIGGSELVMLLQSLSKQYIAYDADPKPNLVHNKVASYISILVSGAFDIQLLAKSLPQLNAEATLLLLTTSIELLRLDADNSYLIQGSTAQFDAITSLITALLDANHHIFVTSPNFTLPLLQFQYQIQRKLRALKNISEFEPILTSTLDIPHPFQVDLTTMSQLRKRRIDRNRYDDQSKKAYKVIYFDI